MKKKLLATVMLFVFATSYVQAETSTLEDILKIISNVLKLNTVANKKPCVTEDDKKLHDSLELIVDMHADTANGTKYGETEHEIMLGQKVEGSATKRLPRKEGHVDLASMVQGNIGLQVFALISEGSAEVMLRNTTFTTPYTGDEEFIYAEWQRNPSSKYFTGPPEMISYPNYFRWLAIPRPLPQYQMKLSGYPCEYWFDKKQGENWPEYINDWPRGENDAELGLEIIDNEQRCLACDTDPEVDYHTVMALGLAENVHNASLVSQSEENKLVLVKSKDDLENLVAQRKINNRTVGAMLALEGIFNRNMIDNEGNANHERINSLFSKLYNSGYRMMALSHYSDSEFGGSNTGMGALSSKSPYGPYHPDDITGKNWDKTPIPVKLGISEAGIEIVKLMMEHGVLVDVNHATEGLCSAITGLAIEAEKPIIVSHGGFQELDHDSENPDEKPNPRNLTKQQILEVASTGGVIGIGFAKLMVGGDKPGDFARAVQYVVKTINDAKIRKFNKKDGEIIDGYDCVALGSDWDGGIDAIVDAGHLSAITRALTVPYHWFWNPHGLKNPLTKEQMKKIMGKNTARVMKEVLPETTYTIE